MAVCKGAQDHPSRGVAIANAHLVSRLRVSMDVAVPPRTKTAIDAAVVQRIIELSADPTPEAFPPMTLNEPLEVTLRRKAERHFQYARACRTWWRLTGDERAQLGAVVMARNAW